MPSLGFSNFGSVGSVGVVNTHVASIASMEATVLLTRIERIGVIIMSTAGVLSCVLVSTLLISIIFGALSSWSGQSSDRHTPFINKQVAIFVISLLISDLIQSISGIMQVKWAVENKLYEGTACSIQAATLVMGDIGSTVWSSVIAVHTFCGLALGKPWSRRTVISIIVVGWSFTLFLTLLGPFGLATEEKGPFFSTAGTWCFISSEYAVSRLLLHYVPLLTAAAIILILYGLVFLVLRGTINFRDHSSQRLSFQTNDAFARHRVVIAKRMLWYPVAYLTAIMPIAVIRLLGLKEEKVPEAAWILAMSFLFCLGAVDAVIYTWTRHLVTSLSPATRMQSFRLSLALATQAGKSGAEDAPSSDATIGTTRSLVEVSRSVTEKSDVELERPSTAVRITTERIQEVI